jgi:hypothetical protein
MGRDPRQRSKASDPGGTSGCVKPVVMISFGNGKSRSAYYSHKRKYQMLRDAKRQLDESDARRVRAFAEAAVAGMKLDEDAPL